MLTPPPSIPHYLRKRRSSLLAHRTLFTVCKHVFTTGLSSLLTSSSHLASLPSCLSSQMAPPNLFTSYLSSLLGSLHLLLHLHDMTYLSSLLVSFHYLPMIIPLATPASSGRVSRRALTQAAIPWLHSHSDRRRLLAALPLSTGAVQVSLPPPCEGRDSPRHPIASHELQGPPDASDPPSAAPE